MDSAKKHMQPTALEHGSLPVNMAGSGADIMRTFAFVGTSLVRLPLPLPSSVYSVWHPASQDFEASCRTIGSPAVCATEIHVALHKCPMPREQLDGIVRPLD